MNDEYPSIKEILDYWEPKQLDLKLTLDLWEPCCWACDQFWGGSYDSMKGEYWVNWEKAPVQRCHIIPKSLGGGLGPINFVLMCKECHDLAPNTDIPEIMIEWVKNQNNMNRFIRKVLTEFESFEIPESQKSDFLVTFQSDKFKTWCKKRIGIHWPQSGYSGTGHKIIISTWVGLYKAYKKP